MSNPYISSRLAAWLVIRSQTVVEFIAGELTRCPLCGNLSEVRNSAGMGVRYHRCRFCRLSFKSVEQKQPSPSGKTPDTVDKPPKIRHCKGRTRKPTG